MLLRGGNEEAAEIPVHVALFSGDMDGWMDVWIGWISGRRRETGPGAVGVCHGKRTVTVVVTHAPAASVPALCSFISVQLACATVLSLIS